MQLLGLGVAVGAKTDSRADPEFVGKKCTAWRKAVDTLGKTTGLVAVTCDRETYSAFVDFGARAIDMAVGLRANSNTYEYSKEELAALLETARAAICKGLGIEELEYPHHRPKMPVCSPG